MEYVGITFITLTLVSVTVAKGVIDIHFLSYEDDCREYGTNKCDPMFTFCVTRPSLPDDVRRSRCWYRATSQSGNYDDTDYINFERITNIKGIANPWKIAFDDLLDTSVKLVWEVHNSEPFPLGSKLQMITSIVISDTTWQTLSRSKYVQHESRYQDHVLKFNFRIYCTGNTYGSRCQVYCAPPTSGDHFYCDPHTGIKKCLPGWVGANCNTNVNECTQQGVCVHGTCKDTAGSYTCTNCEKGYTGPNCDQLDDPCASTPCGINGDCTSSDDKTQYSCRCFYPYTGPQCDTHSPTTTEDSTTTAESSTARNVSPSGPATNPSAESNSTGQSGGTDATTTEKGSAQSDAPIAQSSRAGSTGFQLWIALVIAICLFLVIGCIVGFFVCRRRKRKRKEAAQLVLPTVTYDSQTIAFDNAGYCNVDVNKSQQEDRGENMTTTAPVMSPSFQRDDVEEGSDEMDDDGYLKAKNFTRGDIDGLTASGRAKSNIYSNFDTLGCQKNGAEYEDEQHYHDLDETAMVVRNALDSDDVPRPINAEEEGAYSDIPRNTPSYKKRGHEDDYDSVKPRPDSRQLPKLPDGRDEDLSPKRSLNSGSTKQNSKKNFYPEMPLDPLRKSDPFSNHIDDADDDLPHHDLPDGRRGGNGYNIPKRDVKAHPSNPDDGGYETPTGIGLNKTSSEYMAPSRMSGEYASPIPKKKRPPVPEKPDPSILYAKVGDFSLHDQSEGLDFPPPPPPLTSEDLDEIESLPRSDQSPRPLSFHYGQSEQDEDEKGKKRFENGGFLNPLFGSQGPSDNPINDDAGEKPGRPLSFHPGQTEKVEDDKDNKSDNGKRMQRENGGFLNPLFGGSGPSDIPDDPPNGISGPSEIPESPAVSGNGTSNIPEDQNSPDSEFQTTALKPAAAPLYMENLLFDINT